MDRHVLEWGGMKETGFKVGGGPYKERHKDQQQLGLDPHTGCSLSLRLGDRGGLWICDCLGATRRGFVLEDVLLNLICGSPVPW